MAYTINANAKNVWIRDNENTRDLSIQTDASSVYLDNGRTLEQELGEGSMVSNVATVDSAMSKVIDGTLDGVYESCVFKGKSLVNLMTKTIDTTWNLNLESWSIVSTTLSDCVLKPNTTYSVIVYVTEKTCPDMDDLFWVGDVDGKKDKVTHDIIRKNVSLGANVFVINTVPDFSSVTSTYRGGINFQGSKFVEGTLKWKAIILEGDWTNKELPPYFTGLCDVKMPILRNIGKNLYEGKDYQQNVEANKSTGDLPLIMSHVKLKKNTDYCISYSYETNTTRNNTTYGLLTKTKVETLNRHNALYSYHHDGYEGNGKKGNSKQLTQARFNTGDFEYLYFGVNSTSAGQNGYIKYYNIQLEELSSPTPYESHKTNILRTSEEIVLREVGGVCDTYNPLTGEYTKRIGELVVNGSESWGAGSLVGDTMRFGLTTQEYKIKTSSDGLCDKIPYIKWNSEDVEHVRADGTTPYGNFIVWIKTSRLSTSDTQGFKQWLSQNPLTVQYILAEPVTTIIEPLTIPFAYENGHIILESGSEEQSLLPTLEYSTVVNRTGQVEGVAKVIQKQEKKLTMLEQMLIQNIIELDYNNTVLALNLEINEVM